MTIDAYYYKSKYEQYLNRFIFNQRIGIISKDEKPIEFDEFIVNKFYIKES